MNQSHKDKSVLFSSLSGVVLGGLYGLGSPYLFNRLGNGNGATLFEIMTFSFLFVVSFALGYATVYWANVERQRDWRFCFFIPWLSTIFAIAMTWLSTTFANAMTWDIRWEYVICIFMISPFFLLTASMGGWVYYLQQIHRSSQC